MLSWLLRKIVGIPEAPELSDSRTPGLRTSEGQMTLLSTVIAAVLALLAIWFPDLPREELREVLLWIAGLLGTVSTAAYTASRAAIKREIEKTDRSHRRRSVSSPLPPRADA